MDSMDCEFLRMKINLIRAGFDPIPPSTPLPSNESTALDILDDSPEAALDHLRSELDFEILEIHRVLQLGGYAVWRSAAKRPWYRRRFELAGFRGKPSHGHSNTMIALILQAVECIDIREDGKAIDRVNMYASCELIPFYH